MKKIIGNWKCNLNLVDVVDYFNFINMYDYNHNKITIGIAVPSIWLLLAKSSTGKFRIYSQDVDYIKFGSHTGKLSYEHLLNINVNQTIIGHSETRSFSNNSDEEINKKVITCLDNDIEVILCIGEPINVYEEKRVFDFIINQIKSAIKNVNISKLDKLTIAYEPIWAIGTNRIPSLVEIYNVILVVKEFFKSNYNFDISVLYGGSVNTNNVANLSAITNLDGFLIGSASIDPKTFVQIVRLTGWDVN